MGGVEQRENDKNVRSIVMISNLITIKNTFEHSGKNIAIRAIRITAKAAVLSVWIGALVFLYVATP